MREQISFPEVSPLVYASVTESGEIAGMGTNLRANEMTQKRADDAEASSSKAAKAKDRRIQQKAIGNGLREYFDSVVAEPIPDEFLALLKKMDGRNKDGDG